MKSKRRHLTTLTTATKYVLYSTPNLKNFEIEYSQWTDCCYNKVFHDLFSFNFIHNDANLLGIRVRLFSEMRPPTAFLLEQCEHLPYSNRIHLKTDRCERAAFSSTKTERNEYGAG